MMCWRCVASVQPPSSDPAPVCPGCVPRRLCWLRVMFTCAPASFSLPTFICLRSIRQRKYLHFCLCHICQCVSAPKHVLSLKYRSTSSGGPGPEHVFLDKNPSVVKSHFYVVLTVGFPPAKVRWDGREYETRNKQEFKIGRAQRWSERIRLTSPDLSVRRPRGFIQTRGAFPARRRRPEAPDVNKRRNTLPPSQITNVLLLLEGG